MHTLPPAVILLLRPFAPRFSKRVWRHVQVLLAGAILAPAQRTVTAALRVVGLGDSPHFQRYHRVLNRASWSSLAVSRVVLRLLVAAFVPDGPLVVGVDETLERRTGAKIAAKGVSRDAVRSSHSHFVKATGLRWVSVMLLPPDPVGTARLGPPLPDRPRALRARHSRAGQTTQSRDRLGMATPARRAPLVARPRDRRRRGQRPCRDSLARPLYRLATPDHGDYPLAS